MGNPDRALGNSRRASEFNGFARRALSRADGGRRICRHQWRIVRVPRPAYFGAQGVMGCLIATSINPQIIGTFLHEWPIFIGVVISIIAASSFLGWLMSRWRVLPGTTSIWGSWPGAASAMVVMAEAFGADARLVAFMQYLRVACVAGLASIVAAIWVHKTGAAHPAVSWFPTLHWPAFSETILLAAGGAIAGRLLKITSGSMLVPMLVGAILHVTGAIEIELPRWLLAGTYALLGWNVGLGFTPAILAHAWRALPKIFASIVTLISFRIPCVYPHENSRDRSINGLFGDKPRRNKTLSLSLPLRAMSTFHSLWPFRRSGSLLSY